MSEKKYLDVDAAYDSGTLTDWYISSVDDNPPVWTDEHIYELMNDFYIIPKDTKPADVAPVVHGHWSKEMRFTEDFMGNRTYGYKCSVCGKLANRLQFCGNCGAKMNESEDNDSE